jgi:hypothetical protein
MNKRCEDLHFCISTMECRRKILYSLPMFIIQEPIVLSAIQKDHSHFFDDLVKIVVDLEKGFIAVDGEMHADLEQELVSQGSDQKDLWGANLYFNKTKDSFIEYTSLINIRPSVGNMSMEVQDASVRQQMDDIIHKLIQYDV